MVWKTTLAFFVAFLNSLRIFRPTEKSILLALPLQRKGFLLLFLFGLILPQNFYSQVFIPDGNYDASEYAGAVVKNINPNASGTCEVKQVYSVVKSDDNGPYLLLGLYNGNAGKAIFRYYLDTNPNLDLVSETYKNTTYSFPGADVVLQIDTNDSSTLVYQWNGTSLVLNNSSGLIAKVGDFTLADKKFIEIKVPLSGNGSAVNLCDLAEGGIINLGSYLSFSGGSLNAAACINDQIGLDINVTGTISGGKSYCAGSSNSTTLNLTGNFGAVSKWQKNEGLGWVDIPNTANTSSYIASNVSVTTTYRALIVNNTCPDNEVETGIATITIIQTPAAPVTETLTQPTCDEATGSFSVTAVGGLTYSFNGGAFGTTTSWSGLSANNYTVIAKNSSECISEELTVTINAQPETPTAEIANNNGLDLNCSNPSTTLTASGGVSYSWSNGSSVVGTSAALEVTAAGTYTVTVTGENGCTATISETVTLDDSLPAAAIANDGLELSCNITSLTLTASGGVSYSWSNGSSVVGTSAALEVTAAKTYTVTVTGENGCTATISETVTLDDSLPAAAIANDGLELSCNITSLTLTATGGISYSWSNGSAVVGTSAVLEVTAAGTYTVTVTGENGCTATSSETVTLDDSLPAASIANEGLELSCNITSLTLTASGGVSYSWSNGSTVVGTSAALEVTEAGTYTVTVTGENGCTATASETITLDDSLPAAAIANDGLELSCSVTSTTLTASGGVSYSWSNGSSVVGTSAALEVTAAGTYTVTVTGENGCTATASETITLDDSLPAAAIANDGLELSCSVTSTTLTASGGVSYSWSNGSTVVGPSAALEVTEAGIYTVTVTGENGCTATVSETVTLDDSLPTAAIANDGLELSCNITSLTLTASGGVSYSWSNGSTVVGTSAALEVTAAGTYTVTVTGENGCTTTASETVTLDDSLPAATIANEGLELSCSVNSTTLTASGGVSYSWSKGSAVVGTSAALEVTEAGIYTVTVTGDNGCTATASETVTLDDTLPTATIANEGLELSCTITSLTLTASGGVSYSWSNGSSVVGTSASLEVTEAGTYTVTVTGENGCTAIASETVTLDDSLPAATIANDGLELTCNINSVTLTASGGVSYSWSNGSTVVGTSAALGVTEAGIYTVTVTGENGCTATASETVTLDDSLPAAAIANEGVELSCSVNSTILTASGGVSYSWSNGSTVVGTSAALEVTEAGTYTVTVTGENGCTATVSETVTLDDSLPAATIANEGLELSCKINSLTLTASGGVSYSWSNGSTVVGTSAALEVTEAGTYTVTVTGENGCTATVSETVTLNDSLPAATIANEGLELSCKINSLTLTASGGVSYSYSWSNGSAVVGTSTALEVTEAGTYTVTVTGENGCTATVSETVTLDDSLPAATIANEGLELSCKINSLTLTASGGVSYSWSNGSTVVGTSAALEVTEAGTYTVTVTGENGCTATVSETVTLNDSLPAATIANEGLELSCKINSLTLTASGGVSYSYSWSNGSAVVGTSTALEVTEAGTYTVTVTGENGCTATASETVTLDDSLPTAAIANDGLELSCNITTLTLTASGGVSYSWSNGSTVVGTSAALEVTEAGTYTMTVTGENGCTATASETVTLDDSLPSATIANEGLELSCNITALTLTATGGVSYSWSNGSSIVGTSAALEVTEAGTYTVTVTGKNGCTATASETVTLEDSLPTAAIANEGLELSCNITTLTLTASGGVSYSWSNGSTVVGTSAALEVTEAGTYTVTVTGENGCTATASETITLDDSLPAATIANEGLELSCSVISTTLTASGGVSYSWSNGSAVVGTSTALEVTEAGTYTVTVTGENGCTATASETVTLDDSLPAAAIANDGLELSCNITSLTLTASGGVSYSWSNGSAVVGTSTALEVTEAGTYTVTVTGENGCTATASETVTLDDSLPAAAIANDGLELSCNITSLTLIASGGVSYSWSNGSTVVGTSAALEVTEAGTYTVTVTGENGCTATASETANFIPDTEAPVADLAKLPTVTGECSATVSVVPTATDNCGGTIQGTTTDPLTYTDQGNYKITWTFDDGNGNSSTAVQNVIVDDVTAPEAVTIADATGECEVTVTAPTTSDNCSGTITGTTSDPLTYTEQGSYEITWTFDDGNGNTTTSVQNVIVVDVTAPKAITIADATGECEVTVTAPTTSDNCSGTITGTTSSPLTYIEQGNYQITWMFDDGNGNTSTSVQNVNVDDVTAPAAITIPDATGECEVTVSSPTTSDNCSGTITGTTTDPLTYSEQGNYKVTWTFDDGNGNTTTSIQDVIVDDVTAPTAITLADATGECEVTVTAPTTSDNCSGTITGTTSSPLTYIEQGNYQITWTFDDGNGNTSTSVQNVNVDDVTAPETITIADATGECEVTVSSPTTSDNCSGTITGTTTDPLTYTEQGSYEITWTFDDGNGNTTTSVQNVIVDGISAPVLADVVQPGCEVTTGSFTVTTIAGLEYTIDGENFSASGSFEGLEPGVYTVAAINEAGCLSPLTEVVINETASLPAPVIANTVQPTCEINTGSFTVTGEEGITYSIDETNYQSGVEFSDLAPGSYNVTARNEEGCISPATVVTIEESAVAEPIGDTTVNLCDESYDLFDLYEGIDENGVWEDPLQSGALTGSIVDVTILQVGTYSFNYVTGGNCPSTTTVEVTVNDDCIVFDCSYDAIKKGISKVVTPGTDNHNDFFVVDEDRECGFTYGIQIFNRWGAEVYSSRNYDNDWNGYSSKSVTGSNQLPSGTYFYIVQIDGGTFEPIQGYIYLGTK